MYSDLRAGLKALPVVILTSLVAMPAAAQTDKSGYTFFNATPQDQMRELSTDRPDQTESPYTVDAGHFQLEMDLWNYTRDREREGGLDLRTKGTAYAPINFKLGLTNSIDLQIVADTYLTSSTRNVSSGALVDKADGFGDVTTRLKINLWGNDGGTTALALMPFIKIPTNSNNLGNNKVEGGMIVPLGIEIADGIGVGLMTEVDFVRNGANTAYSVVFVNTATVGFDVTERVGMYTEIFAAKSTERNSNWEVSFDAGVTYALTNDVQLDTGVNIGITKAAPDFNPFVGVTFRF